MTLMRKFLINDGKTMIKDHVNELEAFRLADNVATVINASSMGFGDPASFPIRGLSSALLSCRVESLLSSSPMLR